MGKNRTTGDSRAAPDEDLLLQLMEYTQDALWVFSPDWDELIFVNSAFENIFGQSVAALEAEPTVFLDAVAPEDRPRVQEAMATVSAGTTVDVEFRVDPDDDYRTWVWVQGQPIFDDDGEVAYIAGYTRDITERKEYQQQLEQHKKDLERSNESLREFAYIASHDLQEPLRMVSSYVDLLESEYGDQLDGEAREYMEFAVDGARRMKRMINSLLEYSRVHTQGEEFAEVDTRAVFEATRQDLKLLIDDHDAEVVVDGLPTVVADRDQLGQIFQNLVKNAIDHADSETAPKIEVSATERDDSYVFAVSDDGPGIPESEQDEVFKIFQRGTSTSNDNTGIGLAITQRIVQRHGGTIRVDSEPGDGATFRFTIPKGASQPDQEFDHP